MTAKYWIKLYHEVLHDPKMARMPDPLWRRTIELFLIAGDHADDGSLPCLDDIAWTLRVEPAQLQEEMEQLQRVGILSQDNGTWIVTKFVDRQGPVPGAERVARYRERQRQEQYYGNDDVTIRYVEPDTDTDTEKIREEADQISAVQRAAEELTGLLVSANDIPTLNQWEREGVQREDIQDALSWRKDNNRPPVKTIAQLAGGVATARSKRIQGKAARASPVRNYTAGLPEYEYDTDEAAPTLSPAPEFAKTWASFCDTIPKPTQTYASQVAPVRSENGSIVFQAETQQVAEWCASRWKAVLETQFMHPVVFEVAAPIGGHL